MQLCNAGEHLVSSRTIYGGTYAFMKNFLPKFQIKTDFVNITDLKAVENAITQNTKMIYCEAVSNPLLEVADIKGLAELAEELGYRFKELSKLKLKKKSLQSTLVMVSATEDLR